MLFEVAISWNSNFELIKHSHIKMTKIIVVTTQEIARAWFYKNLGKNHQIWN